jgi:hypothetical protein
MVCIAGSCPRVHDTAEEIVLDWGDEFRGKIVVY